MKEIEENILGCFVSYPANYHDTDSETVEMRREKGKLFEEYIWGRFGISDPLKKLRREDYGKDLKLVLCQFYLLPLLEELAALKEIERYRPKERAIGLPIIVHDQNFYNKSDYERRRFFKEAILEKLDLLAEVVKNNNLDTDVELLKSHVAEIL